jgi:hypothetical protein
MDSITDNTVPEGQLTFELDWPHPIGPVETEPWSCTCCSEPTRFRFKKVELCIPCALNLRAGLIRQLQRDPASQPHQLPVDGVKCSRRGHRPTKSAKRSKAA